MWLRRYTPPKREHHVCHPPTRGLATGTGIDGSSVLSQVPDGTPGDLWMCPDCRGVWIIREDRYWTGSTWARLGNLMAWYARARYNAWQALGGSTAP